MKALSKLTCGVALAMAAACASADPIYVGFWNLYTTPSWATGFAPVLSGQEAAATLFGGLATDYVISTNGSDAAAINYSAWYDVYGGINGGPHIDAQSFRVDAGTPRGFYDTWGDTSAMVQDSDFDPGRMNYAFRVVPAAPAHVPEPLSCGLMGVGLLGLAVARRRRAK